LDGADGKPFLFLYILALLNLFESNFSTPRFSRTVFYP